MKMKSLVRAILALVLGCLCSLTTVNAEEAENGGKYPSFEEAVKAAKGKDNATFRFEKKNETQEQVFARKGMNRGAAAEFDSELAKTLGFSKNEEHTGVVYVTWDNPKEEGNRTANFSKSKTDSSSRSLSVLNGLTINATGLLEGIGRLLGIGGDNCNNRGSYHERNAYVEVYRPEPIHYYAASPRVDNCFYVQDRQRNCQVRIRDYCRDGNRGSYYGSNRGGYNSSGGRGGNTTLINNVYATSSSESRNTSTNNATNNTSVTASNGGNNGGSTRPDYYRGNGGSNGGNNPSSGPVTRPTTPGGSNGGPTQREWDRSNKGSGLVFREGDRAADPGGDRGVMATMASRGGNREQGSFGGNQRSYSPGGQSRGDSSRGVMSTMASRRNGGDRGGRN